jgi:hypothetical protein
MLCSRPCMTQKTVAFQLKRLTRLTLSVGTVLALSACAWLSEEKEVADSSNPATHELGPQEQVPKFSEQAAQTAIPNGWSFYRLAPHKKNTAYRLENYQGKTVLSANAKRSASGLAVKLRPQPASDLWLEWEWKAVGSIPKADNAIRYTDDAPLRILVAFDGNKAKLPLKEKLTFEMASILSGREMPYATLMYIWSGNSPLDSVVDNTFTSRIKMIAVDSGWQHTGEWRKHARDLSADYRAAFGEEPGDIIGVALLTDTDNTKSQVKALYGDIELVRKPSGKK